MTTDIDTAIRNTDLLPECARPTCHDPVAVGKDGKPLKYCDPHRDKRPSASARKASTPRSEFYADVEAGKTPNTQAGFEASFGTPRPAPKPSAKPSKRQREDAAIRDRMAAGNGKAKPGSTADFPVLAANAADAAVVDGLAKPILGTETPDVPTTIRVNWHKSSGKFLAIAKRNGKPLYRYGATEEEAESKMKAALAEPAHA